MPGKAHGAERPRKQAPRVSVQTNLQVTSEPHIIWIGEEASTAQRCPAPSRRLCGAFLAADLRFFTSQQILYVALVPPDQQQ